MKLKISIYSISIIAFLLVSQTTYAQFVFPKKIERNHPRLILSGASKEKILLQLENSKNVKRDYEKFKSKISSYVEQYKSDPEWLSSRFQMYWKSHATDVFVNGEYYSHAEGKAPVPTVRFTGQRDYVTDYRTPKFEDMKPYLEDARGLWLQNKNTDKWEWVKPLKTGRVIENINSNIMKIARDAAMIYYVEGDVAYAKLASHLFDIYMKGIYYRNAPVDLKNGNVKNIIGFTSFQVIKEGIVAPASSCFDFLYGYLKENKKDDMPIYTDAFKKMADIIIKHGIPDNNWNLHQANLVIKIALILDDDSSYADGKGSQFYLNTIFNETSERQWSVTDVLDSGYDSDNGIWNEGAGYALSVAKGFIEMAMKIQEALDIDILKFMPIIPKAVAIMPQYLYPNKYTVAFGDSHYGKLHIEPMLDLVANAQYFGKHEQEEKFTSLIYMLEKDGDIKENKNSKNTFQNLLYKNEVHLDKNVQPANEADYMTNTFYAPTVSWLVQRNGLDSKHGLMISQAGSLGNHSHSNGIAMELYGKGLVLAPEGGRGSSYFQLDYREYYSQFPAHNTVSVNGKSQYQRMRGKYPFKVNAVYPDSERKTGYYPNITFSDLYFNEPSTNSNQNRVMSIVRTGDTSGYYIDVFRSTTKEGSDTYHDYFYHNLGQELTITDLSDTELNLIPTKKLTSANGNIKAYDYKTDEQSIKTDATFKAKFNLNLDGEETIRMNMWMNGHTGREIFKVKSPRSEALRDAMIPKDIAYQPLNTIIVRQTGEAWNKPFVAIYEPSTTSEPKTIKHIETLDFKGVTDSFVGLKVESLSDRSDYIFSSDISNTIEYKNMTFTGTFGIVTTEANETTLFLGSGKSIGMDGFSIETALGESGAATLVFNENNMHLTADSPVILSIPDTYKRGEVVLSYESTEIKGQRLVKDKQKIVNFIIPKMSYQLITIEVRK
ncbi:heparinase II/III family protein [uncultured Polaribacter sp.]|uniref:heparinase II/III domain-containing protein n=1 Tax=uncultured Polaribacter sp. TaxID=174711 RepID=UPI00260E75FF|nr:heparinase II/III family protein [uncultured Polaribacter sp.]